MKRDARLLRVLRAEHDLTQSAVGKLAGMSQSRYWQIENGEGTEPSAEERAAIATALRTKVADIAWPVVDNARASA